MKTPEPGEWYYFCIGHKEQGFGWVKLVLEKDTAIDNYFVCRHWELRGGKARLRRFRDESLPLDSFELMRPATEKEILICLGTT